jgi:hypothetical protein
MADTKISALTAVTTPVAGTSVLPIVQTGTTKKITITELTGTQVSAAGEVGIGGDTTGVVAGVSVTSKFCVKNEGANPVAGFVHVNDTTANSGSNTFACRSRGTLAVPTIVQNNDSLWNMYIAGNDGTDLALAAEIRVEVDGTPGSNDMPGRILLRTTPDGSQAPVDAVKIDSAQNVTVSAGNLVIGTAGKGIDFSGVGTAAEILDDYEEGTWTPVLIGATTAGVGTYTSQVGYYTKIGNIVRFALNLWWTAHTGTGGMRVSLPFTPQSGTDYSVHPAVGVDLTIPANMALTSMTFGGIANLIVYTINTTSPTNPNALAMDTDARLYISGQYQV